MQTSTAGHESHRQLLMHCDVTNAQGETSERYVDHSEFSLWRYLLGHKHSLEISAGEPCVWVPEDECRRHDKLFARAAFQMPVSRLIHQRYDERTGITEKRVRFVPDADLDLMSSILEHHFASQRKYVVLDVEAGTAISTRPARRLFRGPQAAAYCAA